MTCVINTYAPSMIFSSFTSVVPAHNRHNVHPPLLRRRRGGQPSNRNALNHGLYAAKNQTPLTNLSSSLTIYRQLPKRCPAEISAQIIRDFQEEIGQTYQSFEKAENNRSKLAWFNTLVKMIKMVAQLKTEWVQRYLPAPDLEYVSQHALAIIHFGFRDHGITRDSDSFRKNFEKSDFNSPVFWEPLCSSLSEPPYPYISPRQWVLLEPLIPPWGHAGERGRPPVDPRELLDAVFWKLAHHARWQDLPAGYPPMLSCRRYYRRLYLSGRLSALYYVLYQDLRARGKVDLPAIVDQGFFTITENKVNLHPDLDETWQTRTALLLIQQGFQVLRRFRREKVEERRCRFPSMRRMFKERALNASLIRDEENYSFPPIDLSHLGPKRHK
jgi:transposase